MIFHPPIAISLSPNTEKDDVWLALKTLFQPWKWVVGNDIKKVEDWFRQYFNIRQVYSFNSGRSAFYAILKSFNIGKGDEVLVQAFTCVAAVEPILWVGAKPIYVDIDKKLNLSSTDLKNKITKKTKAVVVQHTFGIAAEMGEIIRITKKHNLILIEDCAHSLGAKYRGRKVGSFGQAAYFSFGRDKVVSSVFGGIAMLNENLKFKIENLHLKFKKEYELLKFPKSVWVVQQLLHPIFFNLILPLYNFFNLGKISLVIFQKANLLSIAIYPEEKQGGMPKVFPKKLPNGLAILALNQLDKLERFNKKRKEIAKIYADRLNDLNHFNNFKGGIYLRYPVLVDDPEKIYQKAKEEGIILGRWYTNVIDPIGVDLEKAGYKKGSCENAEKTAKKILNLPTYPRLSKPDAEKITKIASKYGN